MKEWQSQAHLNWDCKHHVVNIPKYRQRVFFGNRRKQPGQWSHPRVKQAEQAMSNRIATIDDVHKAERVLRRHGSNLKRRLRNGQDGWLLCNGLMRFEMQHIQPTVSPSPPHARHTENLGNSRVKTCTLARGMQELAKNGSPAGASKDCRQPMREEATEQARIAAD